MEATKILQDYREGLISPEESAYRIKKWEDDIKFEAEKASELKALLINDLSNFNTEMPDGYKGLKIEIRSGRRMFDFKGIKTIENAKKSLKALEERHKSAFLSLEKGIVPVDQETGEIIEVPSVSYGKDSLILSFKK